MRGIYASILFLLIAFLLIPMTVRKMDEAKEIRNGTPVYVTVATKRTDSVYAANRQNVRYWVSWPEAVGSGETMVPADRWNSLSAGDRIAVVVTHDGKAHLRGGNSDSLETEYWFLTVEGVGAAFCVAYILYAWRRWRRMLRQVAERRSAAANVVFPDYRVIGSRFRIEGTRWDGPVVATADAFYLFQRSRERDAAPLVAKLVLSTIERDASVPACSYDQLPESLRNHPEWLPFEELNCPVIVLGREQIKAVNHRRFSNMLDLETDAERVSVEYSLFTGSAVRQFLTTHHWPLMWDSNDRKQLARTGSPAASRRSSTLLWITGGLAIVLGLGGAFVRGTFDPEANSVLDHASGVAVLTSMALMLVAAVIYRRNS